MLACLFASLLGLTESNDEPYFYILDKIDNKEYKLNLTDSYSAFAATLKINKKIELQFTGKVIGWHTDEEAVLRDYYWKASTNLFNFDCDQPTHSHENYDIIAQKNGDSVKLFLIYQFEHNNLDLLNGCKLGKMSGVKQVNDDGTYTFFLGYNGPEYIPPSPDKSPEQNASQSPEQNPKSSSDPSENVKQVLIPGSVLTLIIVVSLYFIF